MVITTIQPNFQVINSKEKVGARVMRNQASIKIPKAFQICFSLIPKILVIKP
jgi:hypothetical protein